ncbi:FtsX-like permease family protein [Flavobacterium sp. Sd200]|uniref:ABC transporter permease n=1 Tax=Flavobacterium sp. Sd200 TaxID=2692211 RepID=UPI00136FD92E|nr:ABC transporter permease [Flavobacterium sp. Sd200]MXN91874.1 FtsX-like permease family protein [Flavobacterium sp. Sd200]
MLLYLRLLKESFAFAMNALTNNKLRTFLSLLGVTIGIFSIIAVLAAVDSLDHKIKQDLNKVDKNTMYLKRFSFGPTDVPRWKVQQFPNVTYDEYQYLKSSVPTVQTMAFQMFTKSEIIRYEDKSATGVNVIPVSFEFLDIQSVDIEYGRFYNESESNSGSAVVVLGYEIAQTLFGSTNALEKKVRIYGQRFTVIGVLKKQGSASMGMPSNDTSVMLPVNFLRRMYGDHNSFMTPIIIIKPLSGADPEEAKAQITQKLRAYRGIKQGEISNFMIDILSSFTEVIDNIVGVMNVAGWVISGFSLLVGGFGIANIMFVSVKERTNIIGIQKSLGAKNRFILMQFLFEAVLLSLVGGVVGLIMVWGCATIASGILDFEFILSPANVLLGTGLSAIIGLLSGILPAISAAKLDPVEAIRSGM